MEYALPVYVYACLTDAGVVMLDTRRGKYLMVPVDRALSLVGVVQGWPAVPTYSGAREIASPPASLLESLARGGLIVDAKSALHAPERVNPAVADRALCGALDAWDRPTVRVRYTVAFLRSAAYTAGMFKFRPFESVVRALRKRKGRGYGAEVQVSLDHVRECVRAFTWLRPFAYAEADACLFDSVVLTDFLYRQGVFAELLIAVRTRPFLAHSWVQAQGFVLNEVPEYIRGFTPILCV
jgi:hypothetical protein